MNDTSVRPVDAASLRDAGRQPETPFRVTLTDGGEVTVRRLLRVLPGKRIVGEGEWNGRSVLVKLFVAAGSARHCSQERAGIAALLRAGLPTPDLLLTGKVTGAGDVLLTAYLEGARSLAEDWIGISSLPPGNSDALDILLPAFRLLGSLHASGLVQDDLHLGNFLRCGDRVLVIDGDAVCPISPGKALDDPRAAENLAILLAQLPPAWDACRSQFLAAYREGGGSRLADAIVLEKALENARTSRMDDFLSKTVRDCTLFSVQRNALRFTAVVRQEADCLAPLLAAPDEALLNGRPLKDGRTCTVAQVAQGGRSLVIKRYNLKSIKHALARFWRPSRAWHSWREGHRLKFLDIPTPAPLGMVEERIGPWRRRAFLVTEYCPGTSLLKLLSPDQEPATEVAQAIIALFRGLATRRISHGDLKATNLLWHDGKVYVIDLDAVVQHRSVPAYARAWRRDRARLLRNWPQSSVLYMWFDRHLPTVDPMPAQGMSKPS